MDIVKLRTMRWLLPLLMLGACLNLPDGGDKPAAPTDMASIKVPAGFAFGMTALHRIDVLARDNQDLPLAGVPLYVYTDSTHLGGKLLLAGQTAADGSWQGSLPLPAWHERVFVYTPYLGLPSEHELALSSATTSLLIGGSAPPERAGYLIEPPAPGSGKTQDFASRYVYMGAFDNWGTPGYLESERDPISQDLLDLVNNSLPEGRPVPTYNPEYIADTVLADTRIIDSAEVWITFVHEGASWKNALGYYTYDISNPPATSDDIDSLYIIFPNVSYSSSGKGLNSGDKVRLGVFPANTGIGWFWVPNGWAGNKVKNDTETKFSNKNFNTYTTAAHRSHVALLKDQARELLLLGMEDMTRPGGDNDFNDAVFYVTANPFDAIDITGLPDTKPDTKGDDGDGVKDNNDAYPQDSTKAFDSYSPGEGLFGSLAYEDLWPLQGDYDMNDLVLDYNVHFMTNTANRVSEMALTLVVRTAGGSLHNGFGIQLDALPADIASVTGTQLFHNIVTLAPNGVEAGQAKAVIIAFDDAHRVLETSGGDFANTEPGGPVYAPDTVRLVVKFANPVPKAQLGYAPFNAFIFSGLRRGYEVHLPDLADTSLFGTGSDTSRPADGRYYRTSTGLPWAMHIPVPFDYPVEKAPIIRAYLHFATWVESGGTSFSDWYLNENGYRDAQWVY
ncbi:MAG: hypothetical protein OHK0039_42110 [Bacteroidia bacterium]